MYQNQIPKKTIKILTGDPSLQILKQKLELAVKKEQYEKASILQREIEKLSGKNGN